MRSMFVSIIVASCTLALSVLALWGGLSVEFVGDGGFWLVGLAVLLAVASTVQWVMPHWEETHRGLKVEGVGGWMILSSLWIPMLVVGLGIASQLAGRWDVEEWANWMLPYAALIPIGACVLYFVINLFRLWEEARREAVEAGAVKYGPKEVIMKEYKAVCPHCERVSYWLVPENTTVLPREECEDCWSNRGNSH